MWLLLLFIGFMIFSLFQCIALYILLFYVFLISVEMYAIFLLYAMSCQLIQHLFSFYFISLFAFWYNFFIAFFTIWRRNWNLILFHINASYLPFYIFVFTFAHELSCICRNVWFCFTSLTVYVLKCFLRLMINGFDIYKCLIGVICFISLLI